MQMAVANFDGCSPAPFCGAPVDARKTTFIPLAAFLVFCVYHLGHNAQIFYSVVATVVVDMVNLIAWPLTVVIRPNNPMRQIAFT